MQKIIPENLFEVQRHQNLRENILNTIKNIGSGKHTLLIKGENGIGKTVLAANCALNAGFTFTKIINSDRFLGFNEQQTMA